VLLFGSPTFFWSYDTFMTVSRLVLGSSIRVLVFRRISLIFLFSQDVMTCLLWLAVAQGFPLRSIFADIVLQGTLVMNVISFSCALPFSTLGIGRAIS
jgi:hypothetical protein